MAKPMKCMCAPSEDSDQASLTVFAVGKEVVRPIANLKAFGKDSDQIERLPSAQSDQSSLLVLEVAWNRSHRRIHSKL